MEIGACKHNTYRLIIVRIMKFEAKKLKIYVSNSVHSHESGSTHFNFEDLRF